MRQSPTSLPNSSDSDAQPAISVISLGEAGNFGDDLILTAVVTAIGTVLPDAGIAYLSHGQPLSWSNVGRPDLDRSNLAAVKVRPEFLWVSDNRRLLSNADLIVFGGGGLLQDSHSVHKPYQWLSYLPDGSARPPILAVGHGFGPLSQRWQSTLRRLGNPFDESWVRDTESLRFSNDVLGWPALLSTDFVSPSFVRSIIQEEYLRTPARSLGVAIRQWRGLSAEAVVQPIVRIAALHGCDHVSLFVLEATSGRGPDVEFSREVAKRLTSLPSSVEVYEPRRLSDFISRMATAKVALSMKLHASIVWDSLGVPIYPIVYAPKVAQLFGLRYSGLEISSTIRRTLPVDPSVPPASEVIRRRLPALLQTRTPGNDFRIRLRQRILHQSGRTLDSVRLRLATLRDGAHV